MKYKKLLIVSTSFIIVFLVIVYGFRTSDSFLGHISSKIINGNTINLHFRNVVLNDVKIITVSENQQLVIFEKGKQINTIEKEVYGPFTFDIQISKNLVIKTGHWKTVSWGAHDYSISVIKKNVGYDFSFEADGPDYTKIQCTYDVNGKMHGKYLAYYRNGNIEVKSNYSHGKLNGRQTYFYKNGKVRVSENWYNDTIKGDFNFVKKVIKRTPSNNN
jgi:antitoxin component YwqK of YwqJK toxin-antitoxin module